MKDEDEDEDEEGGGMRTCTTLRERVDSPPRIWESIEGGTEAEEEVVVVVARVSI